MPRAMKLLFALAAVSALCACSSKSSPPAASMPGLHADAAITVANAPQVASAVVDATLDVARVARLCARFLTEKPPEPPPAGTLATVIDLTFTGPGGGQALHNWQDVDGDGKPSTGDVFTDTFVGYVDRYTLSGTVVFDELQVVGDPFDGLTWRIESRLHFVNLVVTANGATTTWNGSVLCTRELRQITRLLTLQLDSDFKFGALTLAEGARLERNEYVLDFTAGFFVQGFVKAPELGGTFEVRTAVPLIGNQVLPDPYQGTLEVLGAADSVLDLVPLDFFNVELHVDENGDGTDESVLGLEWGDL